MRLQFREQVEFFEAKHNVLVDDWLDIPLEEHDAVFALPGVRDMEVLQRVRDAMALVIGDGDTLRQFTRSIRDIADAISYWRREDFEDWARRVYEHHLRQSYNAGRLVQLQRLSRVRPYWRYKACDYVSRHQRHHSQWDDLVLDHSDPWWKTHFPANGWACKCYIEGISERDLKAIGKRGADKAPAVEWIDADVGGRVVRTPLGIDPGFAYAPGWTYWQQHVVAGG